MSTGPGSAKTFPEWYLIELRGGQQSYNRELNPYSHEDKPKEQGKSMKKRKLGGNIREAPRTFSIATEVRTRNNGYSNSDNT